MPLFSLASFRAPDEAIVATPQALNERTAVAPRVYITARTRLQWEPRRGN
jgi:hypothetical protein